MVCHALRDTTAMSAAADKTVVWVGGWVGNREAGLPRRVLGMRAVGAAFLMAAVWAVLA